MSVRFDSAGEWLSRSADLPAATPISWVANIYISVDTNAVAVLYLLGTPTFTAYDTAALSSDDGTTLVIATQASPVGVGGTNLSVGQWYTLGFTRNGATHLLYLNGVLNITLSGNNSITPTTLQFGGATGGLFNGRMSGIKMWSAELTAAEIANESQVLAPRRSANLYGFWPLFSHTDLVDYSGNGRSFTANGTLSTEDGPPISWGSRVPVINVVPAATVSPHIYPNAMDGMGNYFRAMGD